MNLDFDKEIDTLLRKAQRDGPVLVGDVASPHLDADEISAFAENAMPERSRALYSVHLADCDRCRKILSNLLVMNAEAVPAASSPSAITIAERGAEPWYRRLFLFPNLAYVMGSLVLIFGGFLAFSVFQNSQMSDGTLVSHTDPAETRGGPNFQFESPDTTSAANTSSNVATNMPMAAANANAAISAAGSPNPGGPRTSDSNFVLDGMTAGETVHAPPPPAAASAQPMEKDVRDRDDLAAKEKAEDKGAGAPLQDSAKNDAMLKQQQYSNMPSQSGPMRNNESQYQRQLENLENRRAAAKKASRDEEAASGGRKSVGGRTFERKQGVWYDTNYHGRPTINVRRGSAEFDRLDGGLRSIANSLSGTIVVVWGAKAYRIQ